MTPQPQPAVTPKTKAFKEWDRQFTQDELQAVRDEYLDEFHQLGKRDKGCWDHTVIAFSYEAIKHAVYVADDVEDWQRFRVALKGLSTEEKLRMLEVRFHRACLVENAKHLSTELIRLSNYIGALVRGGQLSTGTYNIRR